MPTNYIRMGFKYEKQFRKENPQTIGETDSIFDLDNYKDWLEEKMEDYLEFFQDIFDDTEVFLELRKASFGYADRIKTIIYNQDESNFS